MLRFSGVETRYTRGVKAGLFIGILLLCGQAVLAQNPPNPPTPVDLETGKLIEHVPCIEHPEQSYALYLPSNYTPARRWPIVYSFDPGARGTVPVRRQQQAAERLGYILAASNNAQNGAWQMELAAADAMDKDTHARLSIDDRAVYFAGFSGGARLAAKLALVCKCAAGVLLSGAGFAVNTAPTHEVTFPVFSTVGAFDFNYEEVIPLQDALDQAGYPRLLYVFEGSHDWAPAEGMEQALAWFRVQAMKAKRQPSDAAFLAAQLAEAVQHADSRKDAGDALFAWREYMQIVATFDGLADVSAIRTKADQLGKDKSVRDAAKREREDFAEQTRLENDVLGSLAGPPPDGDSAQADEATRSTEMRARQLREGAERATRADRIRVFKRAVAGVFVGAVESGAGDLERRDYAHAVRAFSCATEVAPDSEWAWRNLAMAHGFRGNRKESIAALKRVHGIAADQAGFVEWIKTEPAFERIRTMPEFQFLLK